MFLHLSHVAAMKLKLDHSEGSDTCTTDLWSDHLAILDPVQTTVPDNFPSDQKSNQQLVLEATQHEMKTVVFTFLLKVSIYHETEKYSFLDQKCTLLTCSAKI